MGWIAPAFNTAGLSYRLPMGWIAHAGTGPRFSAFTEQVHAMPPTNRAPPSSSGTCCKPTCSGTPFQFFTPAHHAKGRTMITTWGVTTDWQTGVPLLCPLVGVPRTEQEQRSMVTMWSIARAPLIWGGT